MRPTRGKVVSVVMEPAEVDEFIADACELSDGPRLDELRSIAREQNITILLVLDEPPRDESVEPQPNNLVST